ncbi:hypothetical protein, partial [Streptomyces sp900116325]|uniref:hypothetical protein n=1 Tax=Streptomyces sp. 900116325 TaxID=3154295 RepID=UPI003333DE87
RDPASSTALLLFFVLHGVVHLAGAARHGASVPLEAVGRYENALVRGWAVHLPLWNSARHIDRTRSCVRMRRWDFSTGASAIHTTQGPGIFSGRQRLFTPVGLCAAVG